MREEIKTPMTKPCVTCNVWKPMSCYSHRSDNPRYFNECKKCNTIRTQRNREKQQEKEQAKAIAKQRKRPGRKPPAPKNPAPVNAMRAFLGGAL
jgi:hypothetical protein